MEVVSKKRAMARRLVISELQPGHWAIIIPIVQGYITNTLTRDHKYLCLLIAFRIGKSLNVHLIEDVLEIMHHRCATCPSKKRKAAINADRTDSPPSGGIWGQQLRCSETSDQGDLSDATNSLGRSNVLFASMYNP